MQKTCARCRVLLDVINFGRDKNRKDGLNPYCKACARERSAEYVSRNAEKVTETKKAYYNRNSERILEGRRKDPRLKQYWKDYGKRYRKEFAAETLARTRKRQAGRKRATPPWFDRSKVDEIYREAKILRESGRDVEVDHIIPLSGRLVCGLHWHGNLRIVDASLNRSKGNKLDPSLPPIAAQAFLACPP